MVVDARNLIAVNADNADKSGALERMYAAVFQLTDASGRVPNSRAAAAAASPSTTLLADSVVVADVVAGATGAAYG
ncbi:MAG TPA: hypothetical protein VG713_17905 [Pirellulales bacterium]|nr:hypothetical protein [Pirellulales bacterium]